MQQQKHYLNQIAADEVPVFTSLHISEEFTDGYTAGVREMCRWLAEKGYRVMADVSPKTVQVFGTEDLVGLAEELQLSALRLDYGFTENQTESMAAVFPLVVNASTLGLNELQQIKRVAVKGLTALHNFYPRPETGLDDNLFTRLNHGLTGLGIEPEAFIAGDKDCRGPLMQGLPTLEKHRNVAPLAAYADLTVNFGISQVFLGDLSLDMREQGWIQSYCQTGVLPVPAQLEPVAEHLYGKVFTCRPDSPAGAIRFAESREYSCHGGEVPPANTVERPVGCITMDNTHYQRYSGEVQLLRCHRPADQRVNVIGQVPAAYHLLLQCIHGGTEFCLMPL